MEIIARIYNNYSEKFGIPRQSGLVGDSFSKIIFEPEYRNADALRGLEGFSHIWLIWEFSEVINRHKNKWSPTVRPPRLGGNERIGVFASRSPFRPNPIGLSCVKLEEVILKGDEAPFIRVSGADLMNGTPIYDIKPYIAYADAHPEASSGWVGETEFSKINVEFEGSAAAMLSKEEIVELREVLENDPRPAYRRNSEGAYRFTFAGKEITIEANADSCRVIDVSDKRQTKI